MIKLNFIIWSRKTLKRKLYENYLISVILDYYFLLFDLPLVVLHLKRALQTLMIII